MIYLKQFLTHPCNICLVKASCNQHCDKSKYFSEKIDPYICTSLSIIITIFISWAFWFGILKIDNTVLTTIATCSWVFIGIIIGLLLIMNDSVDGSNNKDIILFLLASTIIGIPVIIASCLNIWFSENLFQIKKWNK